MSTALSDDRRVEPAERLDVVCVQVLAVEHGVQADDALVELGRLVRRVGGRVEGAQPELGVPGDGEHLVEARAGEARSDRERKRWRTGGQGEGDAEGA